MHEARIVANLEHPQAVRLHDFGQMPDGNFFMVMEFLEGESLAERLAHKFLTWREVFDIIAPICRVLGEAHKKGVVHRDLKPENIFITRDSQGVEVPKLIDFGVARQLDQATITHAGAMWGTPAYMSPEQARGDRVEAGADNYAIGIILYELICGTLPFNAASQMGYAVKHMHEIARGLTTMPGLTSPPEELDALILSLLEKDPALRPGPAEHIADLLDGIRARWFDDALLDLAPALEIDPVALQGWLKESVVDASASMERAAYASLPSTPPHGALGMEVSRTYEDLAIAHLPTVTPAQTAKAPQLAAPEPRAYRLTALITAGAAIAGVLTLWAILNRPDAQQLSSSALAATSLPQAQDQPATSRASAGAADERVMDEPTQDALSRGGARAAQTIMHARIMATPAVAPQIRTIIRRIRVKSPEKLPVTETKKAEPNVRDAIKNTL
jgi:serine/threonine protein kinase